MRSASSRPARATARPFVTLQSPSSSERGASSFRRIRCRIPAAFCGRRPPERSAVGSPASEAVDPAFCRLGRSAVRIVRLRPPIFAIGMFRRPDSVPVGAMYNFNLFTTMKKMMTAVMALLMAGTSAFARTSRWRSPGASDDQAGAQGDRPDDRTVETTSRPNRPMRLRSNGCKRMKRCAQARGQMKEAEAMKSSFPPRSSSCAGRRYRGRPGRGSRSAGREKHAKGPEVPTRDAASAEGSPRKMPVTARTEGSGGIASAGRPAAARSNLAAAGLLCGQPLCGKLSQIGFQQFAARRVAQAADGLFP